MLDALLRAAESGRRRPAPRTLFEGRLTSELSVAPSTHRSPGGARAAGRNRSRVRGSYRAASAEQVRLTTAEGPTGNSRDTGAERIRSASKTCQAPRRLLLDEVLRTKGPQRTRQLRLQSLCSSSLPACVSLARRGGPGFMDRLQVGWSASTTGRPPFSSRPGRAMSGEPGYTAECPW